MTVPPLVENIEDLISELTSIAAKSPKGTKTQIAYVVHTENEILEALKPHGITPSPEEIEQILYDTEEEVNSGYLHAAIENTFDITL